MNTSPDLAIVIVSWNVWDLLRACLRTIEADSDPSDEPYLRRFGPRRQATCQVIVVDNNSHDPTPDLLPSQFPWVRAILSETNLGFTGGNNLALNALGLQGAGHAGHGAGNPEATSSARTVVDHSVSPTFVYFLNPDTELLPNSLWTLFHAINGDDRIGAVGPQLLDGNGVRQSTRRRFPTPLTGFFESTWLGRRLPTNPWVRHYHVADWPDNVRQDVDWLVGAALLVRWTALAEVGPFDDRFFMYSEELDLCKRLKQAGWRVVYDPASIVIHHEGRSSEQVSTQRHILFNRSKVCYYRKYHGRLWAALLRVYLLWEFRWQLMIEGTKALVGHRRALRRARMDAYRQVIKSGLR